MPDRAQTAKDQRAHIPAYISQAMDQHMQQAMPAHLKKYVGSERPAYIPQHVEKQIAQHMDKTMPGHLKQYSGAYMQQKVIQPNRTPPSVNQMASAAPAPHAPLPDLMKRDHSMPTGEQFNVQLDHTPPTQPNQPPQPLQPQSHPLEPQTEPQPTVVYPENPPVNNPHHEQYDFIMEGNQPPKKPLLPIPRGNSMLTRVLMISGLLIVLLVGFTFVRNLLSGGSALPSFVSIAQDQQVLIHLASNAYEQQSAGQNLTVTNQNFAATAQLSLTSSQSALIEYLTLNKQKTDAKICLSKISAATDERLTAAAAATTYNETFKEIMKAELTDYISHLQQTYDQTKGEKGRALLSDQYDQAKLLLSQLEQAEAS